MSDVDEFKDIPTTTLADLLGREQVMDIGIRPLWGPVPRPAGPAFTVRCPPGDNLMLHAAIYRAEPGSVVVVESGGLDYALAGGNVCAVAQRRGIAGFVADGLIRDLGEVRESGFPVFARRRVSAPQCRPICRAVMPSAAPPRGRARSPPSTVSGVAVGAGTVGHERAVGAEGQPGEAFADAAVGGGVRVELVGQRQFGEVGLAVEGKAVEVVQVGVVGRPLLDDVEGTVAMCRAKRSAQPLDHTAEQLQALILATIKD